MYEYSATVVRWVDGDTVDLRVDLGFRMFTETRFRLHGIDTPERGESFYSEATALANETAPVGSLVHIHTYKNPDKYGRWLVEITTEQSNSVSNALLGAGYADVYTGGARS